MNLKNSSEIIFSFILVCGMIFSTQAFAEYRSMDGSGNNLSHHEYGKAGERLLRESSGSHYADGISAPGGTTRPSARLISNDIFSQPSLKFNGSGLSDWVWQWGQFIDHDLSLTNDGVPKESFNISVPTGDPFFDPTSTGTKEIVLNRFQFDPTSGTGVGNPREHVNTLTSWIDGSMIYGSAESRATWIRSGVGGVLKVDSTAVGDLMPKNDGTQPNGGGLGTHLFVAGDVRANEQTGLTAVHTLFVREHNRLAEQIAAANPGWSDEQIYLQARTIVGGEVQAITYNEWLPALLGPTAIEPYVGYDASLNPQVSAAFSTAGFRIGHTMLSPTLLRVDDQGRVIPQGNLSLRDSFFTPAVVDQNGIDSVLKGLASQLMQEVDVSVIDDVRNFLFGPPGAGGFDLVSLNIQRARDLGLADYNTARVDFGLAPVTTFAEITSDPDLQLKLQALYGDVNNIDLWVGGLAEDHLAGSSLGALFQAIWIEEFTRVRNADRFWYQIDSNFSPDIISFLGSVRLSDIILWNSGVTMLQDDVFHVVHAPEPSTLVLFSLGGLATAFYRRKKKKV